MTDLKITPARRQALHVLAGRGIARESNSTSYSDGHIYWQSIRALAGAGLIELTDSPEFQRSATGADYWVLTAAGRDRAVELGFELKAPAS